jgi:hypothetical protein
LRSTLLHFSIPLFSFFLSFLGLSRLPCKAHLGQTPPPKSPPPLPLTPLLLLCPRQTPCAQPAVAALLNASGSEDSHRGLSPRPIPAGEGNLPRHTPENVADATSVARR